MGAAWAAGGKGLLPRPEIHHFEPLPPELVGPVRAATRRYSEAKSRLEAEANAGLAELVASLSVKGP